MNITNRYPDKENLLVGRPVVKDSDVDRVRRNLTTMPLKQLNLLEHCDIYPRLQNSRPCVNSPVTELANTFTELAANESSVGNTPKRRLSLTSSSEQSTPELPQDNAFAVKAESHSSSPNDLCDFSKSTKLQLHSRRRFERRSGSDSAFRRYHSMPLGCGLNSEASPLLSSAVPKCQLISPLAQSPKKPIIFTCGEEDSADSAIGRDDEIQFAVPSSSQNAQAENEQSPTRVMATSLVIGSPDIYDCRAQDSPALAQESPLMAHQLCSHDDETDDGFVDLDELEKQGIDDVPDSIAGMFTGKLVSNHSSSNSSRNFRGSLFKSPSVPNKLETISKSFDIRRRVLCAKRPDPPRDSHTPVAAHKKRRSVVSDGDMQVLPSHGSGSQVAATTCARLQKCKSMVEHSATYEMNKTDTDKALTGDFSRLCVLPLVNGKHEDLKCISSDTMARLVNDEYEDLVCEYTVLDCRYPYEYDAGHIKGAENVYTKDEVYSSFLSANGNGGLHSGGERLDGKRSILIFHCEFSSERAPRLSRFLRNTDREMNQANYPNLYYPEVYLLEGGYKAFYEKHKELCTPQAYKPMAHKDHSDDLKKFRAKSKSWAGAEKKGFRPGLMRCL